MGDVRVHGHAMGQLQRNRSAMPRRTQGAVETRYTRLLRATVFAVIGRPQSAKSTPRHRILQSVRKHVMAAFPAVLPCPIFALLVVLQRYKVLRTP
jgi:hypothetical protein